MTPSVFPAAALEAGTYIVYSVAERGSTSGAIEEGYYAITADEGASRRLFALPLESSSSLSPDGKTLAYAALRLNLAGRPELMLLDMETGDTPRVPDSLDCGAPSWSPDGKELALVCGRDTKNIQLMTLDDYGRIPLVTWLEEYEEQLSPEWSPDGKWLAFLNYIGGQIRDPREGIYLMDTNCLADPGSCRQATRGPLGCLEWFVWSSDSREVGCVEGSSIRFIDISSREEREMQFPRSIAGFAWSPTGDQLAVSLAASTAGGYTDVFFADVGGENLTQITHGKGDKTIQFWLVVP
jgi:Tol biopolymer transport system component